MNAMADPKMNAFLDSLKLRQLLIPSEDKLFMSLTEM